MAEIHAEHAHAVLYFLLRLTGGDRDEAEDMLQETMLRTWRHIDSVPSSPAGLRRWLLTVARHATVDATRRRRVRPQETELTDGFDVTAADDTMATALAAHTIREALRGLSSAQRSILTDLYVHGHPIRQVAAVRGIPEGTVKSRAHHAVEQLRKATAATA
jgi:RNA polymerase sigma-70 factor (ECF subfamily)